MDYEDRDQDGAGRGHYGNTSNFSTTAISDDGRFLGIKLSKEMASQLRTFYPALLDWGRRQGEKITTPVATKFAKGVMGATEHEAAHFAGKASNVVGYGIILSNQIFDVGRNVYDSVSSLNELRSAVAPLSQSYSGSTAPLSGDNEVVVSARNKIKDVFWQRLLQTVTGSIAAAPALIIKLGEQKKVNKVREKDLEYERVKNNPEAYAEYVLKEAELKAGTVDREINMKAREMAIKKEETAYLKRFEGFNNDNEALIRKELEEFLKLTPENVNHKMRTLREQGFDVDELRRSLTKNQGNVGKAIEEFETATKYHRDELVKQRVRAKFVKAHGAFDTDWDNSYNRKPTIREQIERKFDEIEERSRKHKGHDDHEHHHGYGSSSGYGSHHENKTDISSIVAGLGAGLAAEFATKALGKKASEKYAKPIALDRVLHLRRELEKSKDSPPDQVPDIGNNGAMSYTKYVHEIFQQHQRDWNRTEIGERFTENLDKARWDDDAIRQLSDDQLNPYEFAIKTIAKRIKDGRMDALALIELTGDKRKKIVQNDGRTFGPLTVGRDDAARKKAIAAVIDEKTAVVHSAQKQSNEQINDKLGNFVFSITDLNQALVSKDMDEAERAFIFTVFTDVVGSDETLCKKVGIPMEKCQELRQKSKEQFTAMMDGTVAVVAEMIESEPEKLAKLLKLTEKEKELILSLSEKIGVEGKHVLDETENIEARRSVETVVANAAMVLRRHPVGKSEDGKPADFWQQVAIASKKPRKPAKEAGDEVASKRDDSGDSEKSAVSRESKRRSGRGEEPSEEMMGV